MINDKQFYIGKRIIEKEGWSSAALVNGYYLSWQNDLRVRANKQNNIILLGHAWQTDPQREDVHTLINSWGGME